MINHYSLLAPISATLEVAFCVFDIKHIVVWCGVSKAAGM